jgi:hypothetical protein
MTAGQLGKIMMLVASGGVLGIMSCILVSTGAAAGVAWGAGGVAALVLLLASGVAGRRR